MKHVLVCDLEQSALLRGRNSIGIGSYQTCAKVFDTKEEAEQFATEFIRKRIKPKPTKEDLDGATVLEWFQDSLGGLEWFHVIPVVE